MTTFEYVDIHSHIYFPDFDKDRDEEILKMQKEKIATITIGTDFDTSTTALLLAEKYDHLFACIGQHPGDLNENSDFDERLIALSGQTKVVAIGECGLDYFRIDSGNLQLKETQKQIFESHISMAMHSGKPLMLHVRSSKGSQDANHDALDILENHVQKFGDKVKGNAHFFAGCMDVLKRYLSIGFTVSFTGVITFTHDYDEYVRYAPLDMIMSETDAPFVAPVPHRGKRSSPLYVPEVVKAIAKIREEDFETVKTALRDNAVRCFGIK